jgi:MoxR-like ATPase
VVVVKMKNEEKIIWKQPVDLSNVEGTNVLEEELKSLQAVDFVILRGPAGIGKTFSSILWGKENNYDVFVFEASGDMSFFDAVGFYVIKNGEMIFLASDITSAVKNAEKNKTLLIFDEINLLPPSVLKSLGGLFDFRKSINTPVGRLVAPDGQLKIIGTMNSETESAGYSLDPALQSRAVVINIGKVVVERMVRFGVIDELTAKIMTETGFRFSLREAEQVLKLSSVYGVERAFSMVLGKYDEEIRKQIREAINVIIGRDIGGD